MLCLNAPFAGNAEKENGNRSSLRGMGKESVTFEVMKMELGSSSPQEKNTDDMETVCNANSMIVNYLVVLVSILFFLFSTQNYTFT